ncbi:hypothetical protein EVAR_35274_1 [Eumeta japonica]|uniref:Uncharacterized protein n=1 Tax=Eumeta variegata TaxID=151549 RepID=A0A4C1VC17_EUMVA|nr:hypothetical protein EVAR_35274_1 [Eumeta japonica]
MDGSGHLADNFATDTIVLEEAAFEKNRSERKRLNVRTIALVISNMKRASKTVYPVVGRSHAAGAGSSA